MNNSIFDIRRAGLLTPTYALRHSQDFGIGDTIAIQRTIDFCSQQGFTVLQLLPIFETIGDPSPYSPISSHALSPSLLSLTPETVPGLNQETVDRLCPAAWKEELQSGNVRYHVVQPLKQQILAAAYKTFMRDTTGDLRRSFETFKEAEATWLAPYTLYRVLVSKYEGDTRWTDWRPEHRTYSTALHWLQMQPDHESLATRRDEFAFMQWVADRQWRTIRSYAQDIGVRLIGDLPFGMAPNSCDVWAEPSLFDTAWSMGTRPLSHFDTSKDAERWGQNWGFPPYRWENHRSSSFHWFNDRIRWMRRFFHGCRIDHLRGYFRAYMFPWSGGATHVEFSALDENQAAERTGGILPRFVPGPDEEPTTAEMNRLQGNELISRMIEAADDMDLVAEIMGSMPQYMSETLESQQLANLAFPQLLTTESGAIIPPEEFRELSLVSYANHDNAPLAQLYPQLVKSSSENGSQEIQRFLDFIGWEGSAPDELTDELLEKMHSALFRTSSRLAVLLCSDYLGLPLRFNLPGSYGEGAWSHRLPWSFEEFANDPKFGPRMALTREWIRRSGRDPRQKS